MKTELSDSLPINNTLLIAFTGIVVCGIYYLMPAYKLFDSFYYPAITVVLPTVCLLFLESNRKDKLANQHKLKYLVSIPGILLFPVMVSQFILITAKSAPLGLPFILVGCHFLSFAGLGFLFIYSETDWYESVLSQESEANQPN